PPSSQLRANPVPHAPRVRHAKLDTVPPIYLSAQPLEHPRQRACACLALRPPRLNHPVSDVTQMLLAVGRGEAQASEDLLPLVYDELRRHAAMRMSRESPGQTLQPTALVHEAWLRMAGSSDRHWQNRAHFFGAAAEAMRRILIE